MDMILLWFCLVWLYRQLFMTVCDLYASGLFPDHWGNHISGQSYDCPSVIEVIQDDMGSISHYLM